MKKNIFISILLSLSSYVAYIGSNGELHNIIEISQGFAIFVFGQSLLLIGLSYFMERKNIPAYILFVPMVVIMLSRRLWNIDWPFVYDIGLINYDNEIKFLSVVILIYLSVKMALRFKYKLMNICLIFVVAGLYAYSKKAYSKATESYNNYKIVQSQKFKDDIKQKIESYKTEKPFVNRFNVYHILIDSYPNKDRLKQMTGYDITPFYNELKSIGFNTYDIAYSTGKDTTVTLNAMFNMKFQKQYNKYHYNGINKTFLTFLSQGYKSFCDYPCLSGWGNIGKWNENIFFANQDMKLYIWHNFFNYYFGTMMPIFKSGSGAYGGFLNGIDSMQPDNNYFMYMHEVEHPGFFTEDTTVRKNKLTLQVINKIVAKDKNAIIIFGSDHGSRNEWSHFKGADTAEALFSVVLAVKFPPQCKQFNNIPILTSVNYYKYVFACLRGEKTVTDLQSNESYKKGALNDYWNDKGDKNTYIYIRDNKILKEPELFKGE